MKQLLQTTDHAVVCALNDRAFVVFNGRAIELEPPTVVIEADPSNPQQQPEESLQAIQAVAIMEQVDGTVWCAVSRFNKSLALYQVQVSPSTLSPPILSATTVHSTTKRAGCLTFTTVPDETAPLDIIIAGDLTGDATAFSLLPKQGRLLLGHTASMLTGVRVVGSRLLTSDRDEKVRISQFPTTTIVLGYLLGHTAFVSCMDATDALCVTCGGDSTIRLWDLTTFAELCKVETTVLPTRLAMRGNLVVVIYEGVSTLELYQVTNGTTLTMLESKECSSQPLAVDFPSDSELLVLVSGADYLIPYSIENSKLVPKKGNFASLQESAKDTVMPTSVMEMDKNGIIKLQKLSEDRGPAKEKPWNRVERIQKSKEGQARRKKRQREAENEDN
jgi:WD40 repeat protein